MSERIALHFGLNRTAMDLAQFNAHPLAIAVLTAQPSSAQRIPKSTYPLQPIAGEWLTRAASKLADWGVVNLESVMETALSDTLSSSIKEKIKNPTWVAKRVAERVAD